MQGQQFAQLQVIGVRYRGSRPAQGDERALDAYAAADVYARAGVPVTLVEPAFPEDRREVDEPGNLGWMNGAIAESVAAARRAGAPVLLSGGDCTHCTGVLGGLQQAHGSTARIGMVWFDAHGDYNTPKTTLSGMLGGMPVAVCAGLAYPHWRERAGILAPLPTERILLVDVRNLDAPEEQLIRATETVIAGVTPERPGADLGAAVDRLAAQCDLIYLHIDSDILDQRYVPNHGTREPDGPSMEEVQAAIERVMAGGKVAALAVVSIYGEGEGSATSVAAGIELIGGSLAAWQRHGTVGT